MVPTADHPYVKSALVSDHRADVAGWLIDGHHPKRDI
jgi:hypothetical protein